VRQYVAAAVARLPGTESVPQAEPDTQRQRVTAEARRVLRAFVERMPHARWNNLAPAEQDRRMAGLVRLVADRLGLSLTEVTAALEAPMDALLHQERQHSGAAEASEEDA
jgi:hypothetical protein